jgi:hypothetical protein
MVGEIVENGRKQDLLFTPTFKLASGRIKGIS